MPLITKKELEDKISLCESQEDVEKLIKNTKLELDFYEQLQKRTCIRTNNYDKEYLGFFPEENQADMFHYGVEMAIIKTKQDLLILENLKEIPEYEKNEKNKKLKITANNLKDNSELLHRKEQEKDLKQDNTTLYNYKKKARIGVKVSDFIVKEFELAEEVMNRCSTLKTDRDGKLVSTPQMSLFNKEVQDYLVSKQKRIEFDMRNKLSIAPTM